MILDLKPSRIVALLLIANAHGTEPSANGSWPVFNESANDSPDNLICVYDYLSDIKSQNHINGDVIEHYGIQIKVRSEVNNVGFVKIQTIADYIQKLQNQTLSSGGFVYTLHGAARKSGIMSLGRESGDNHLWVHTVNFSVSLTSKES